MEDGIGWRGRQKEYGGEDGAWEGGGRMEAGRKDVENTLREGGREGEESGSETHPFSQSSTTTVEINTDALDTMTLRRLEVYLNDCKTKDQMLVLKAEGKEIPEQMLVCTGGRGEGG
jgi:hypothetical protein